MTPRIRSRRSGVTLVEGLVAAVLLTTTLAIFWNVYISSARQSEKLGEGSELIQHATLVQELLSWDLLRSLPLQVDPTQELQRGVSADEVVLPFYMGYDGSKPEARSFAALRYRFDPQAKVLYRNDRPVISGGLSKVRFRWSKESPTMLEVLLVAPGVGRTAPAKFLVRLPAPRGTDESRHWKFASHHRGARLITPTGKVN